MQVGNADFSFSGSVASIHLPALYSEIFVCVYLFCGFCIHLGGFLCLECQLFLVILWDLDKIFHLHRIVLGHTAMNNFLPPECSQTETERHPPRIL